MTTPLQQAIAEADAVLSDVDASMAIFDRMCEARLHQALADAAAACPDCTPPAAPQPPVDDPLPAIARLWGRLERGEIDGDRYLELLREGGWA